MFGAPRVPAGDAYRLFLGICEQRAAAGRPVLAPADVREPRGLLDYANCFHHDTNPAWETENINDGQLRGFVEGALRFASRP